MASEAPAIHIANDEADRVLKRWWVGMTALGIVLAIASCTCALLWKCNLVIKFANAFLWSLGPPAWFAFERWRLMPKYGRNRNVQEWRDGADLATKFWAGIGLLLAFLYT